MRHKRLLFINHPVYDIVTVAPTDTQQHRKIIMLSDVHTDMVRDHNYQNVLDYTICTIPHPDAYLSVLYEHSKKILIF